jgi:hypothetical protein
MGSTPSRPSVLCLAVVSALQAKVFDKGRSAFLGEPVASTGVRYVYLTPGLHVRVSGGSAAYALLPLPCTGM